MKRYCLLLFAAVLVGCSNQISNSNSETLENTSTSLDTSYITEGSFSSGFSSLENSSQEQIINSSNYTSNTESASVSDPKVEDSCSIVQFIMGEELEGSFVDTNQYGFTYDDSESTSIAINENNHLVIGTSEAGGVLAFNVNYVLSKVALNIALGETNNVKIGYINKSGIKIFYDSICDSDIIYYQFSEKNNPTHIIIKSDAMLEISSICLYKK